MPIAFDRRKVIAGSAALTAATALDLTRVYAQGSPTLRVAMTAADVPVPNGQTDQGAEGMRFVGYAMFDSLILWDLSASDKPSKLVPGLATSWSVDAADETKWIFKIRPNVKFHDGSTFDANAAVWNFDKILKEDAPQFDRRQAAQGRSRIPSVKSYRALDAMTLEITTQAPDALLPFGIAWIVMSSPARWEASGRNWDNFIKQAVGHWSLEVRQVSAARALGTGAQQRLLGQGARAEDRAVGAVANAGRQYAGCRVALGASGLD